MKLLRVLALLPILLLFSCDLFSPEKDDDPAEVSDDLLGSKTIGVAGGELDLDSIRVIVPAGAFREENTIRVSVEDEEEDFGEYGISSMYRIDGLPGTIDEPIRLRLKYRGPIEGDTLIAVGRILNATTEDSVHASFHTDQAADSSGYLLYELPADAAGKAIGKEEAQSAGETFFFIILGGYMEEPSANGHFILSYPLAYSAQGAKMGEHFEEAYDSCAAMGYDLTGRDWAADPPTVLAKPSSRFNGAYFYRISKVKNDPLVTDQELRKYIPVGSFQIDLGILNDDPKMRAVCGHEFFHLVQNLYEFSSPNIEIEQKWLKEAASVWIMEKFSNLPNYVPHSINGREMYPFDGWQYAGRSHARTGYGLSVILKGVVEAYGQQAIRSIFEEIQAGVLPSQAVDPVDAVLSVLNEPVPQFWHGVLGAYVLGHYYDNQVNFRFLDEWTNFTTFTVDPSNNVIPATLEYHDLSGRLFKILPGDLSTLSTAPLSFTVDDPANCGILVCKYKQGTEITMVGEAFPGGSGQVALADAKPLFDAGYDLVVLVSNSTHDAASNYQGKNDVELLIELTGSDVLNGSMEFYLDTARFQRSDQTGPTTANLEEALHFNGAVGSFSNGLFSGNYSYESLGRTFSGNVRITYIDNPASINVHLSNTMSYESSWGFGTVTIQYTVDYSGLSYDGIDPTSGRYAYSTSGSSTCGASVTWRETNALYTQNLISYDCGANAYLKVYVDSR
ncbi:MAG: hypothetical protein JW958_12165 [Candidatus Eisenbacteria bacterium]|nr:hypothetical protein [Candidatus Eisenbacteria bacterium]